MPAVVRMPAVLAGVTEAAVQSWLVAPGQDVQVGDPLAEIETEKAVVEYPSEVAGRVERLLVAAGESVAVGAPIAVILEPGEGPEPVGSALADAGPTAAPQQEEGGRVFASPLVRRLAADRGIDLGRLSGTGPRGRIVRRDLEALPAAVAGASGPDSSGPAPDGRPEPEPVQLSRMRRAIARRLTESKTTVPHFYVTAHCRVDRLVELRRQLNEVAQQKLSLNDFVLKAVAAALREVPAANTVWAGDRLLRFRSVDVAMAVALPDGLVTPVLRDVDQLGLAALSLAAADLAARARTGRLQQAELEGGAFAVSNLGMYGVDEFSAILNPPQSGILAVAAAKPQPVVEDGSLAVGTVMTVTLSADHRVLDGALAAQWLAAFVHGVEHPLSLLL